MSFLLMTCLLLAGTCVHAIPSLSRTYTSSQQLMSGYNIFWTVNQDAQEIYLGFQVQTTGWFGFGLGEPASGSMPGADIMVAYVLNNQTFAQDRFSTAFAEPPMDTACQDWQVVYGAEANGWTVVEVTRKLDTGDKVQDRVFLPGSLPVIFARSPSNSDTLGYHRTFRGTGFITFYGTPAPIPSDLLQDPNVIMSFPHISSYQIPAQQTTYVCQSFELPIDQIRHIIAFEPKIDSTDLTMVHHALIHGCAPDASFFTQFQTPGQCESPVGNVETGCSDVLFGWARGGESIVLPAEAGFRVSNNGNDGGYYRILLQMHYDNPGLKAGAIDISGFKIYMTSQLRPHDAGVITLGDPFVRSLPIPARSPYTEYEYACSPTCTSTFQQPFNVFGHFPHMHALGNRIWTTHWRNGTQLPHTSRTEYFAWTIQKNIPVNYQILPGDRLHTHCGYDTSTISTPVTFGKNSTQEMCMDFVFYWPKQVNMFYCGGVPNPPTNLTVCGIGAMEPLEPNNPARFGFDPVNQRLRQFGNDIPDTHTCATQAPTIAPTVAPTQSVTVPPTLAPTSVPTDAPTQTPTASPSPVLLMGRPNHLVWSLLDVAGKPIAALDATMTLLPAAATATVHDMQTIDAQVPTTSTKNNGNITINIGALIGGILGAFVLGVVCTLVTSQIIMKQAAHACIANKHHVEMTQA